MRRRASVDHHGATLLDTHTGTFIKANRRSPFRSNTTDLDIGGYADAHQLTFGTLSSLFGTQALVIRDLQGFVQGKFVVAGIINCSGSRLIWELLRLDEVDSTYLNRVLAQFSCHKVRDSIYLQTCRFAIPGRRSLHILDLVASMDRRCQSLAAVLNPLDGMAKINSSVSSHKLFGVDIELRAKATTHFGYNHTRLVLGKANSRSHDVTQYARAL